MPRWCVLKCAETVLAGSPRCSASASGAQRTAALRKLLSKPGILLGPAAYDGISARLTEESGFDFAFMSGFSVAGGRLAKPDTGLLSFAEMLDQGRCMHEATRSIPVIGDGDTGYGNAMNVKRTVSQYAAAGFAGILIEDQQWPKSCGHVRGKRVISREEAVARIKAACDARDELDSPEKIVIVARTDARQAVSFQEALSRAAAFADVGADVVFVDALESAAEMRTLCAEVPNAFKMANMLEGGGKTPILTPEELEQMGFKLCAYPLSLLGVSINAMRSALSGLKQGKVPVAPQMPSFQELQAAVGFPEYFEEEAKYAITQGNSSGSSTSGSGTDNKSSNTTVRGGDDSNFSDQHQQREQQQQQPQQQQRFTSTAVEADEVIEPGSSSSPRSSSSNASSSSSGSTSNRTGDGTFDLRDPSIDRRAQWLRIKIVNLKSGMVDLDTRFPAGFLGTVAGIVPQVAGLDLEALVRGEKQGGADNAPKPGEPVFSFETDGERIEIYFEN
ncbi:putative 2,3-dimethylmalate lyase [Nannochloris sp. 'desiccata']|nr:hypothetical protein KSW81_002426 [Chlorella desiccata (nom. nud.)]KAH7617165.1 putative 2,3-dimethylmalate lyase [Chlorella desiccata (nom. nud.)]